MAEPTTLATPSLLGKLLETAQLDKGAPAKKYLIDKGFKNSAEDQDPTTRFVSGLAAVLHNIDTSSGRYEKGQVLDVVRQIDQIVNDQLNAVLHHPTFQKMEGQWRGIAGLIENTNFSSNITVDLLDVSKDEMYQDFDSNSTDVFNGALFSKVYKTEYDQYGGRPYGCLLGLYEFSTNQRDLFWLRNMSKVAAAAHAPFVSSVSPEFFGCKTIEEVEAIRDLDGLFSQPKMSGWTALRDLSSLRCPPAVGSRTESQPWAALFGRDPRQSRKLPVG
jgi:type VI secretion system protein ImpC